MRCARCKNRIVRPGTEGSISIRVAGPFTVQANGDVTGTCHWCKEPVVLPLQYVAPQRDGEQLVLREPAASRTGGLPTKPG